MGLPTSQKITSTIRFNAPFDQKLTLPKAAAAQLPPEANIIEGILNTFPFRATLQPSPTGTLSFKINKPLQSATAANTGDTLSIEITRLDNEPEVRVPAELIQALANNPTAQATWLATTPNARRDWVLWMTTGKQEETRQIRADKAIDMLASGKRRVCCFGGLGWLSKDHPNADTWLPLPTTKGARKSVSTPTRN